MPRTLVITNDFPPRRGGIQTFIEQLVSQMYPKSVVVFTSSWSGAKEYDAKLPFDVKRISGSVLLPTPRRVLQIKRLIKQYDCDQVLFGALAPLAIMSKSLKRAGIKNIVALTHGHEAGWAKIPLLRFLLARCAKNVDVITYLTQYTKKQIESLMPATARLIQLSPAVDSNRYTPFNKSQREMIREKFNLSNNTVLLGVSRLMPRKGFDSVIRSMPALMSEFPNIKFVVVGGGPDRNRLMKLAKRNRVYDAVQFIGSVPHNDLPEIYNLADVFVMPCRTRFAGLDVEGFGIVYLEAAACGVAVIAGKSGGAPEAVIDSESGLVVDDQSLIPAIQTLLRDESKREQFGLAGRAWVAKEFTLGSRGDLIRDLLDSRKK
ncbi:MAG: glycosyltransferase family 4 protein [Actinobacteria bacterium]|nr:glycosyltransferase family 4 protein [Actinomycetota bacterium]